MGRVRTEDGKRVSIGLKVSEAKAEAVDAARGSTPRALWLEAAIDAALAAGPVRKAAMTKPEAPRVRAGAEAMTQDEYERQMAAAKRWESRRVVAEPAPDRVEEVRALAEAAGAPLVPASELEAPAAPSKGKCKHSSMRVRKGPCPDCDEWVTGKSLR